MSFTRRFSVGVSAAALLLLASSAYSSEPNNNGAPWKNPHGADVSLYSSNEHDIEYDWGWTGFESITSSSDVDHLMLSCNGNPVAKVGLILDNAAGDIDLAVYDVAGRHLGTSQGVTKTEYVDTQAFGKQAVVMRVYGYNGATGGYSIRVRCP